MANRIKGITIEIGGDTTGLESSLKGVNSSINKTQRELRDVERLLKLDPSNTELVAQRQKLLAQQIENTRGKLETLKEAEKQAQEQFARGEITEEQYRALQREIAETEINLKNLKNKAGEAAGATGELGDKSQNAATSVKNIGDNSEKTSRNMEGLSKAAKTAAAAAGAAFAAVAAGAIAAGAALIKCTTDGAKYADTVLTESTVTGIATDKLQEYMYAAELVDVSTETLTKSMAKNIKSMTTAAKGTGDVAAAYETLGVEVTNADGSLRDSEEVYWELIDALGSVEDETTRDSLAMQVLGKSAQELNPLITAGSDRMRELGQEARQAGYVLDTETLNAYGALDDQLQRLDVGATAAKNALGTVLLPTLTEISTNGVTMLNKFTRAVKNSNGDIGKIMASATTIIAQEVPKAIKKATEIVTGIAKSIGEKSKELGKTGAQIVNAIISGVANSSGEIISAAGDIVGELIEGLISPQNIKKLIGSGFKLIENVGKGLFDAAVSIFESIGTGIVDLTKDFLGLNDATEESYIQFANLTTEQEALLSAVEANIGAYADMKDSIDKNMLAASEQIGITQNLWEELQTLADENGNVEEADRDRAAFILGELNEALGTEYEMNDGIITQYKDMSAEIDNLIAKKKAEAYLGAYTESYNNAVIAIQEWRTQQNDLLADMAAEQRAIDETTGKLMDYNDWLQANGYEESEQTWGWWYQEQEELNNQIAEHKGNLEALQATYDAAQEDVMGYYDTVGRYDEATALIAQGYYEEASKVLAATSAERWKDYDDAHEWSEAELAALRRDMDAAVGYAADYKKNFEAGMMGFTAEGLKEAEDTAAELTGIWEEATREANTYGGYIGDGLKDGMHDKGSEITQEAENIVQRALGAMKRVAAIASPSKITTDYGEFLDLGFIGGMEKRRSEVEQTAASVAAAATAGFSSVTTNNNETNTTNNLGGITLVVNGSGIDNVETLADLVINKLSEQIGNTRGVFA